MEEENNKLSLRENQILALIRQGQTNREIAALFGVTTGRIDSFVNRIKRKTGTKSKAEMRRMADANTDDQNRSS